MNHNSYLTPQGKQQTESNAVARLIAEAEAEEHAALIAYQAKRATTQMLRQRFTGEFPEPPAEEAAPGVLKSAEDLVAARAGNGAR